ncbi:hypothetical protein NW762_004024 [Fusarium torreyae]|uniref:Uncharacterized protein n=1 Tax=Fusarium torreyae TaxID=1237075 RepID=A0A9W8S6Q9_9HYPO|nr:hypothetical protein NW762_004024 [Fusarium torreyae]
MSAADGFLSSLLYLDELEPVSNQHFNAALPQSPKLWVSIRNFRSDLERCRDRLMEVVPALDLAGLDTDLDSFVNLTLFYEAAIFSFRNTLTGLTPYSLGNVVALCSLSHVASHYLSNGSSDSNLPNRDIFPDIALWQGAIGNPDHRHAFSNLVEALWPTSLYPPSHDPTSHTSQTRIAETFDIPLSQYHSYEEVQHETSFTQFDFESNDLLGSLSWAIDPIHNSFTGITTQLTSQAVSNGHNNNESVQVAEDQTANSRDLEGTAVITNLTKFLEECGESLHVLSGYGVTAKDLHSYVTFNQNGLEVKNLIKSSYLNPLRNDLKGASALGILSVAERFVELGHLQSINEVRRYMIIAGGGILRNDESFDEFVLSVYAPMENAAMPATSSHSRGSHPAPPSAPKP